MRTHDLAVRDADGYFWYKGRSDDLIKSSGFRIGPAEIEECLLAHPAVAEAAVIGIAHEKWGERPLLVVVAKDGASPAPADILALFDGKVAKMCIPDAVEFVDELPHTATGKILKTKLREDFKDYSLPV